MDNTTSLSNPGKVVSVRGSVVDVRFEEHLPPTYSALLAGDEGRIVIEVVAQLDARRVRGIALTAELFDEVPIDQMTDAEHAPRKAAANMPAAVRERLGTADKLSDEDRETTIEIAREAIKKFSSEPSSESEPEPKTKAQPQSESKTEPKSSPTHETGPD